MSAPGRKKGCQKFGGRVKGTPNHATLEFKTAVTQLLDRNRDNLARWLALVADGDGADMKPDPAKALDLVSRLAEYAYPKLARSEQTGPDGGPQELVVRWQSGQ